MKIAEFEYTRKYNLGNFEERVLKVKGTVEEGENHNEAISKAMDQVESHVKGVVCGFTQPELPLTNPTKKAIDVPVKSDSPAVTSSEVKKEEPTTTKTRTRRTKEEIAAEKAAEGKVSPTDPLVEGTLHHIMGTTENIHEPKTQEAPVAPPAEEVKKEEVKKEEPKKVKGVLYSRTIEAHKQAMANSFDSICPTWKSTKLAECKQFSLDNDGKIFIFNEDGNVSEEFIAKAKAALGV